MRLCCFHLTYPCLSPQELIKERFDPLKFLSVFKKGHPTWLDQLIQHDYSRKMIYELSAANKNSLLLNYAIQRILKQVRSCVMSCCAVEWCYSALHLITAPGLIA